MDLQALVGRPVPENAKPRDVILAALIDGKARPIADGEHRLVSAVPSLLADGLIVEDGFGYRLVNGAVDAASAAKERMTAARESRRVWGEELQRKLHEARRGG